ncbi:MAG TPA: CPBP family intramembrane glutamic endopeptidase [Anaerolineales bacterium]|nr:CPBP family intramembrane glutamic endopeptidase [Anaerolineales bacterium]
MRNQPHNLLSRIFISEDQSRLRAGWRILIAVTLTGLFFNFVDWVRTSLSLNGPSSLLISRSIDTLVVTGAIYLTRRCVDKRTFTSMGFTLNRKAGLDLLMGIVITFVLMGFIYLIELSMGWLKFETFAWQAEEPSVVIYQTLRYFVVYVLVGWNEELIYRGYVLQSLASGLNLTWGVIISSLYFGVEHLSNPNSNWLAVGGILFIGLLFAYGYIRTSQLWLPIGMHIGWNFFESTVFGFPVSGYDRPGLFRITVSGPEMWTGGAFGPEAGLIILPICLLGALLINLYTKRGKDSHSTSNEE